MDLRSWRQEYQDSDLEANSLSDDPLQALAVWIERAREAGTPEPNAMALATVGEDGQPSLRFVLLKGLDARGLAFYTNLNSRKVREAKHRPQAAATFWWPHVERQVRVEGRLTRVANEEADAYFASRPRGAQLGAWASPQSREVAGRAELQERLRAVQQRFPEGQEVPRPPFWGGLRLEPSRFEFWQGRRDRLHDRLQFARQPNGAWSAVRLAP